MFNTNINLYAVMLLLSLIGNAIALYLIFKHNKQLNTKEFLVLLVFGNIGAIVFGKLYTIVADYRNFDFENINFLSTGLSFMGGIIGAIFFLILFCLIYKKSMKNILTKCFIPFPLIYGISKIGCFFHGCCNGIKYNGPLSVAYRYNALHSPDVHYFPIQLIEAIVFLFLFIYFYNEEMIGKYDTKSFGVLAMLFGIFKFLLDFLRESHFGKIISFNQLACILLIAVGLVTYIKEKKRYL